MKRHETVEQIAEHADLSSDTYRLLVTGRIDASQPANGRDAEADTARHNGAADAPHGSIYLPRFRFGSLRRRRRTAPLLAA